MDFESPEDAEGRLFEAPESTVRAKETAKSVEWSDEVQENPDPSMQIFRTRADIAKSVRPPVLGACEDLYDKNIRTIGSLWRHAEVVGYGFVSIVIDYGSLSDDNKKVADEIAKTQKTEIDRANYKGEQLQVFEIRVPVAAESVAVDIDNQAKAEAAKFKLQPMKWAPKWTLKRIRQRFYGNPNDKRMTLEDAIEYTSNQWGWYYDPKEKVFYESKEHFDKTKQMEK